MMGWHGMDVNRRETLREGGREGGNFWLVVENPLPPPHSVASLFPSFQSGFYEPIVSTDDKQQPAEVKVSESTFAFYNQPFAFL